MNVATVSLSLRNQIALITGGGRGIGAATAQALASRALTSSSPAAPSRN